jgi:pimeloyl-ACP methyl ester carboxylesterase
LEKVLRKDGDRWRWHWDPRFLAGLRRSLFEAPGGVEAHIEEMHHRMLAAASQLRIPTLLVRGRMSDVVSEAGALEFLGAVPHARYVDVSGAGHMVAGDQNDVFTDAIVAFLRGLDQDP